MQYRDRRNLDDFCWMSLMFITFEWNEKDEKGKENEGNRRTWVFMDFGQRSIMAFDGVHFLYSSN